MNLMYLPSTRDKTAPVSLIPPVSAQIERFGAFSFSFGQFP